MAVQLRLIQDNTTQPHHHHTTTTTTPPPPPLERPAQAGCDSPPLELGAQAHGDSRQAQIERIFDAWTLLHRHGRPVQPRLTGQRRAAVDMALGWGFGEAELLLAVQGCRASDWCQRGNRTGHALDELVWILATAERIERLANDGAVAVAAFKAAQQQAQQGRGEPATRCPDGVRAQLGELRRWLQAHPQRAIR